MKQSDLYLLQTVPPYHLQALVKARRLPYSFKGQGSNALTEPSSMTIAEIGQHLFDPASCHDALRNLNEVQKSILFELIARGGEADSRECSLYLDLVETTLAHDSTRLIASSAHM